MSWVSVLHIVHHVVCSEEEKKNAKIWYWTCYRRLSNGLEKYLQTFACGSVGGQWLSRTADLRYWWVKKENEKLLRMETKRLKSISRTANNWKIKPILLQAHRGYLKRAVNAVFNGKSCSKNAFTSQNCVLP